jgi:hypothetical protein
MQSIIGPRALRNDPRFLRNNDALRSIYTYSFFPVPVGANLPVNGRPTVREENTVFLPNSAFLNDAEAEAEGIVLTRLAALETTAVFHS